MQLILAIVADQQQAAQLAALIDGRLAVDLVQAAEVGEGLLALDDRIPDLILTSPLMSPFDDGVLDEYLRDLGPAGAHVQTLRIPVLSQAPKKTTRLGFLLRRRAKPEATTPEGCEPKVFADEIAVYLARAADEKQHASTNDTAPVIDRRVIHEEVTTRPTVNEEEWTPAYSTDAVAESAAWAAPEPEPDASAWHSDLLDRRAADEGYDAPATAAADDLETPIYEPVTPRTSFEVEPDSAAVETPLLDPATAAIVESFAEPAVAEQVLVQAVDEARVLKQLSVDAVEELQVVTVAQPMVAEAAAVDSPIVEERIATAAVIVNPAVSQAAAPAVVEDDAHKAAPSFKAALAAIRAAWGQPSSTAPSSLAAQNVTAPVRKKPAMQVPDVTAPLEVDLTGAVELLDEPVAELEDPSARAVPRPFVSADSTEMPDVYELSVESDMNELEPELFTPPSAGSTRATVTPAAASAPSLQEQSGDRRKKAAKRASKAVKAKGPRPSQPESAQDEWGVFDPNRCGFAALVDKLDEEVSDEKGKQPRNTVKSRVLSCS
jgi:hypothetical protein